MIVTCPNCTMRLQLDKAKVPARAFSVRCPKCQQIINAQPPAAQSQRDALAAVGDLPASSCDGRAPCASPSRAGSRIRYLMCPSSFKSQSRTSGVAA